MKTMQPRSGRPFWRARGRSPSHHSAASRVREGMANLPRPGCLVRSSLALLGVMFMPLSIWFLRDVKHRYWSQSLALFIGALVCFYFAFRRDTWLMTALDGLDQ
jgi:hypothetical protein